MTTTAESDSGTISHDSLRRVRVINSGTHLSAGIQDIADGAMSWRLWSAMALDDLHRRYHRAVVGILWVSLSFLAFVFVKAVIFDRFTGDIPFSFTIYLAMGFLTWQYMNGIVNDGADVFIVAANWIKGIPMPLSTFVYQSTIRQLIVAFYASLVVVLLLVYEGHSLKPGALLALPGVLMLVLTGIWVQLLVGTVSARYRDIKHLIQTIMRITFFLTPVLWVPSTMGRLGEYTYWNPFANFIEIVRMPILHGTVDAQHWYYAATFSISGALIALTVFVLCRHRIVYWL